MINRILSPFKKVKSSQSSILGTQYKTQKKEQQKEQDDQYLLINYSDPITKESKTLYKMPKACLKPGQQPFHPQDWSISNFEIGRPLGKGKFGHVYLARERQTKYIVALKIITLKQILNSDVVPQIRRQIQIHTHLNHPNIIKMHGFFFDSRKMYYIMEYAAGGQLYKQLKKMKKFPESRVARYIKQMTSALIYIHSLNIFHRDIKPQNILICSGDQLKISDFGWSVRALTTQRRTMCGTMDYLCPEIVQNRPYNWAVDIWTLGVLTYQLATGNAPFYHKEKAMQYKNIKYVNIQYPDYLSKQIIDFIALLLVRNPSKRMKLEDALKHPFIVNNTTNETDKQNNKHN